MSRGLPDQVDVWRMVSGRRIFAGELDLAALPRLCDSLASTEGAITCEIEFGTDEFDQPYVEVRAQGELPLVCQRTLEVYRQPVSVGLRLGLIRREEQEAALPPGYEPLLVPADGQVALSDLVEDELILALPLVPARPDSVLVVHSSEGEGGAGDEENGDNPFSVLGKLRLQ